MVPDAATLLVAGVLPMQLPKVIATSNGVCDGAIRPRVSTCHALRCRCRCSAKAVLVALPENVTGHHSEASPMARVLSGTVIALILMRLPVLIAIGKATVPTAVPFSSWRTT
ncbi:hypothetical protein [Salipiger aestuarii]|uniref:hypothetical protein n=2 Tax=Salipiger aestuarii TaxID=568098 RepID=UPI00025B6B03|nr:hypothetical protein [Salipiger aestuarii]EIE49684.1 hypothetical protein C357_17660 [Citreicella sp. 357]